MKGKLQDSGKQLSEENKVFWTTLWCVGVFLSMITKMTFDKEEKFALTKFSTKKGVKSIKGSDHNLQILELDLKLWSLNKSIRI